jgi:hypothetical protein
VIVREYDERDFDACSALFAELVDVHRALYPDGDVGGEFAPEDGCSSPRRTAASSATRG